MWRLTSTWQKLRLGSTSPRAQSFQFLSGARKSSQIITGSFQNSFTHAINLSHCSKPILLTLSHLKIPACELHNSSQMCFNQLIGLFLLLICLVTNMPMDLLHGILYRIARTVKLGLNITSANFLANMDDPHFTKSRSRWNVNSLKFAQRTQAVDSEVSTPLHAFLFLLLSPNVGRIANISCPGRLNNNGSSRSGQEMIAMRPTF